MATARRRAKRKPRPKVTITVDLYPKEITTTIWRRDNGEKISVTMKKHRAGEWRGTEKEQVTQDRVAEVFPTEDAYELMRIFDDGFSVGSDLYHDLLMGEELDDE